MPMRTDELPDESPFLVNTPTDVWRDLATPHVVFHVVPVVALIETEIAGTSGSATRAEWNCVEGRRHREFVVPVRGGQCDCDRHAAAVGENVSLCSKLRAISWIGSCEVPPFGAFTETLSREAQAHSMPRSSS